MEAFGFVEPIAVPPTGRSSDEQAPTPPPSTPNRRSPRIEALLQKPPTPQQTARIEMEEAFTRRVAPRKEGAKSVSSTQVEASTRRTRSVVKEMRSRMVGQKRRASPHAEDQKEQPSDSNEEDQDAEQDDGQDQNQDGEEKCEEDDGQDDDQDAYVDYTSDGEVDNYGCDEEERDPTQLLVELSCQPVRVPPIQVFHADWAAFLAYMETYCPSTYQILVVFETMNAAERNRRLGKQKRDRSADMLPQELTPFSRVYKCTHGPKPKNRGRGVRPRRFIRYTKCPFRFRVQWMRRKSGAMVLKVTQSCAFHNHVVGTDSYGTYPAARGIKKPAAIARAEEMVSDNVPRSVIYTRMLAMNQNVYKADVDNFVSAHMSRVSSREDDEAVGRVIAEFVAETPDGVVTIDENDRGETGVISLTTPHMRSMLGRFGELVLVDCTHKTNRYDYQLCTFMVMDEFGHGQVVQQSLLETNGDWHMERAVGHLKRANPDCWQRVRVIIVDKDLNEIKILKRAFPDAQILLCHFHVVKYLQEVSHKPQFGKLSKDDHDKIDHLCHNLVYSKSEGEFIDNRAAFQLTCDRLGFGAFANYVHDNWFNCSEMWVLWERGKLPHFANHTNNRLESWFGKFKEEVKPTSSLSECITIMLGHARRCEQDYSLAIKRVGRFHNANFDEEMETVLLWTTPFVADAVHPEYTTALNRFEDGYSYEHNMAENRVTVKGQNREYTVNTVDWTCNCEFSNTMLLPCRHAMAWRKSVGQPVIPLKAIDVRWQREKTAQPSVKTFAYNIAVVEDGPAAVATRGVDLSTNQSRYSEAMRLLKPICSELADIDDPEEFSEFIRFLLAQFRNVRQRKRLGVVSPPPHGSPHGEDDPREHEQNRPTSPPTIELSQTNSLYSAELGDVPAPCFDSLRFQKPAALMLSSTGDPDVPASDPGLPASDPGLPASDPGLPASDPGLHASDPGLHASDPGLPASDPGLPASDPGLHASDPGLPASDPGLDVTTSGVPEDQDTGYEHYDEGSEEDEEHANDMKGDTGFKIKINKKARKSGRPKLNKQAEVSLQRQARAVFNASEKARRERGELTMEDVLISCDKDRPSLVEARSRVGSVPERFTDEANRKPKFLVLQNPTLNKDVFYTLPSKLLAACFEKFPIANSPDQAINVSTPSMTSRRSSRRSSGATEGGGSRRGSAQSSIADQEATISAGVEVVTIAHVGLFSREQIELMRRVHSLQKACDDGAKFVTWLKVTLASKVPASLQKNVREIARAIETMYPAGPIPGLEPRPEYCASALYNLQPPAWLNDGIILGFCERLAQAHTGVHFAGIGSAMRVQRKNTIVPDMIPIMTRLRDEGARHIVMPVNVANKHWIGVYVDLEKRTVNCYDPLNLKIYRHKLKDFALGLVDGDDAVFPDFAVVDIQSPVQSDGFSCGLFVCFKFWRVADKEISKDMTDRGLFTRRLEYLHFVLHGTKNVLCDLGNSIIQ